MLIINPTISTNYQAQKNSKTIKKDSKLSQETGQEAKLCLVLGCLATIAAATIGIKKGRVVSFAEALEKNGVEIKNHIAYIKGNHLYILGPEHLEYVKIEGILEDPTQAGECFDRDDTPYPVPANMIPIIKQMIFERELNIMLRVPSDTTNNSTNDVNNQLNARN